VQTVSPLPFLRQSVRFLFPEPSRVLHERSPRRSLEHEVRALGSPGAERHSRRPDEDSRQLERLLRSPGERRVQSYPSRVRSHSVLVRLAPSLPVQTTSPRLFSRQVSFTSAEASATESRRPARSASAKAAPTGGRRQGRPGRRVPETVILTLHLSIPPPD
jgi:hypothetical protein